MKESAHTGSFSVGSAKTGTQGWATCLARGDSSGVFNSSRNQEERHSDWRGGSRGRIGDSVKHGRGFRHLSPSPLLSSCCIQSLSQELKVQSAIPAMWGSLAKERLEEGQHFPAALQMGALAGGTFESGMFEILLQIPLMSCSLTSALERLGLRRWVDGRPTWHINTLPPRDLSWEGGSGHLYLEVPSDLLFALLP